MNSRRILIQEIYVAALPLPAEQRAAYLEQHCPDSGVREDVERMLASDVTETYSRPQDIAEPALRLRPGSLLGHYRIRKKLGAGGMGWVFEAFDEKLQRLVAIKVLPPGRIDDNLRKRLAREAQAASGLNHPNIVTVYEVGREQDMDFIAMERIAGRTLHESIGKKGLDARSAIQQAVQIADSLAAAHDAGIVHRDLKPANIMVTERGLVKVLDFGLAKMSSATVANRADTAEASLTQPGRVVGTISYMSPEQAEGKDVDARSDIFSFGAVVYEMLTGRQAFHEESAMATLAAVLNKEPTPLPELTPGAPRGLERLIAKCLRKKPHDRWQDMSDVKLMLEDLLKDLDSLPDAAAGRRRFGWLTIPLTALAGALLAGGAFRVFRGPAAENGPEPVLRMVTADSGLNGYPALSRDGMLLAFASDRGKEDNLDIWVQQTGGHEPIRLTDDPADETHPSFSPDGTQIAFRSEKDGGGIYIVPALGGDPRLLVAGGREPRFSPDGRLIAYWTGQEGNYQRGGSRVFVVDPDGGQPRPVHPEMAWAMHPVWSPKGDEVLVLGMRDRGEREDWWALPLDQGTPKRTGAIPQLRSQAMRRSDSGGGIDPTPFDWIQDGGDRVLFAAPSGDAANIWEIGLSPSRTITGPPRRVTRGPGRHVHAARVTTGLFERTVFANETLNYDIWTVVLEPKLGTARGEIQRLTTSDLAEWAPSIAQDGKTVLFVSQRFGRWALQLMDLDTGRERALISGPLQIINAKVAGDGSRVAYTNAQYHAFSLPIAGGAVEKLCERCGTVTGSSFDGKRITIEPIKNEDLLMFDAIERKTLQLAARSSPEVFLSGGQISRDGKWVAFHSDHNPVGSAVVWIARLDRRQPVQPSEWIAVTNGKSEERDPCWAANDGLLYFISERDGFRCIWAQRLDVVTKKPAGGAFPVRHFHSARQSLRRVGSQSYLTGLSVGGDRMVFAMAQRSGNIWLEEKSRGK